MGRIVLLDLNFTLVANSDDRWRVVSSAGMGAWIGLEQYRPWLVDLMRSERVVMLTARPDEWRAPTLQRIRETCAGWEPAESHFKDRNLAPPALKRAFMTERVFPKHGPDPAQYLALESNAATRAMYRRLGVVAVKVPTTAEGWRQLPA